MTTAASHSPIPCPKCEGKRRLLARVVKGIEHRVDCSLCRAVGTVAPHLAAAYERERAALESD